MTPERWERIAALYDAALELPSSNRDEFLRANCSDDEILRLEVESLLFSAARPGLLDSPDEFVRQELESLLSSSLKPRLPDSSARIAQFPLPTVIAGRFRVTRRLGQGGMGVVYEAEDLQLGGFVALKTIQPEVSLSAKFVECFKWEIQVAKRVTHPNVCRIYDIGFHPSPSDPNAQMFLTMELLEGETLTQRLARGPMTTAEAAPLVRQMAVALGAAHDAGVIHRDFKSSNVMLAPHNGDIRAVVMDFGLAGGFDDRENGQARSGEIAGTPEYMAPEQLIDGAITPATDIYALGIVMYEMVAGRRPFGAETPFEAAVRRLHEPPESPRGLVPDLDPRWERTILRCLSRNPEDRFQTTADVLSTLSAGEPAISAGRRWSAYTLIAAIAIVAVTAVVTRERAATHLPDTAAWQQITNFSDSVTDPVLSADGRMLAFKRGGIWFMSPGEIYVKSLPDGQPVQLTRDSFAKMAPVFSPEGTKVAYTVRRPGVPAWQVWDVPILPSASEPHLWLTNADGLTWIDNQHILFSELTQPENVMAVVTSTLSRTAARDVYVPTGPRPNANFSAISPDRKKVLIVEMNPAGGGNFIAFRCRLVPFDGSSQGALVGPGPDRPCIAAAWSPDGKWMYFSARLSDKFHLWRQRTDGGEPQQITFGPVEEEGLAIAPDGRSAITSVGGFQTSVWIHDKQGERQVSGEGSATAPFFSPNGAVLYYLSQPNHLWRMNLRSGHQEFVLPGVAVADYALSPDGGAIAYVAADGSLWYSPIGGRIAPLRLAAQGQRPEFTRSGDVLFRMSSILYRIHPDGTDLRKVPGNPGSADIWTSSLSPDEKWSIRRIDYGLLSAEPRNGGRPIALCQRCTAHWTLDGKFFWISLRALNGEPVTGLFRLKKGKMFPSLPRTGIRNREDFSNLPDVQVIPLERIFPAPDGTMYAFPLVESRWNLYRVPLP